MPSVRRATSDDLDNLTALFDGYRSFYGQPSQPQRARAFLQQRLQRDESVLLLATLDDDSAAGFSQLYPMFSSVSMARVWILNDLFVVPDARRRGVAGALLQAAEAFARAEGALRLELETDLDNDSAQALYQTSGWQRFDGTQRFRRILEAS